MGNWWRDLGLLTCGLSCALISRAAVAQEDSVGQGKGTGAPTPAVSEPLLSEPREPLNTVDSWHETARAIDTHLPALAAQRALADRKRAEAHALRAQFLPSISANAEIGRQLLTGTGHLFSASGEQSDVSIPNPPTTWDASLNLRIPVVAVRSWYEQSTATLRTQAAELDTQSAERLALIQGAEAIVDLLLAEDIASVERQSLLVALRLGTFTRRTRALGSGTELDILRADQETEIARGQVEHALSLVRIGQENLGAALGTDEPWGVNRMLTGERLLAELEGSCKPQGVEQQPSVHAATIYSAAAERAVHAVDYAWLPTIDAVSSGTYWSNENLTVNGKHVTWTVGGTLTWSLYDGGLRSAVKSEAEADRALSVARATDARRVAVLDRVAAVRELELALAMDDSSRKARDFGRTSIRLTQIALEQGGATLFEVVETARRTRETEIEGVRAQSAILRARVHVLLAANSCVVRANTP